jgi:hypothetical protein
MNRVTSFIAEYLCSAARASGQYLGSILKFSSTCFWIQEPAGLDDSLEDLFWRGWRDFLPRGFAISRRGVSSPGEFARDT